MTKDEISKHLSNESDLTRAQVDRVMTALTDLIAVELRAGRAFQLRDLGTLKVKRNEARTGRNPSTGASIQIAAKTTAKFVPGSKLLGELNA
jgi:nucleoid DNA-binding protein